jgi:DNA polymerase-3 subunit delta'
MSETESDRENELSHPRERAALFGHEEAERTLARCYAQGRVPAAFLIGGPRGLGKATLAYRFARILLAGARIDPEAKQPLQIDPGRQIFRLVAAQAHPDLLVLRRPYDEKTKKLKSSIPVDEVRRVHTLFGHRAGAGAYRVCIVDAADALAPPAANALLKTLEEPPARSVFLLIAHAPARLLPTIRSRCRRLSLAPLSAPAMDGFLAQQDPAPSPADRAILGRLAQGRPGRALVLFSGDGLALYRELSALLESLPKPDPARVHALAERLSRPQEEEQYRLALSLLEGMIQRVVESAGGLASDQGERALTAKLANLAGLERWAGLWEKIGGLGRRADALQLDKRQVILSSFEALSGVAGVS